MAFQGRIIEQVLLQTLKRFSNSGQTPEITGIYLTPVGGGHAPATGVLIEKNNRNGFCIEYGLPPCNQHSNRLIVRHSYQYAIHVPWLRAGTLIHSRRLLARFALSAVLR